MKQTEWAVDHARAALKLGMKVPEVEQLLIAKGLTQAEANQVVMNLLEGHVGSVLAAAEAEEKSHFLQLILSALVASVCLILVFGFGGGGPMMWTLVCIVPGLAGIWLPEMMAWKWRMGPDACRGFGWIWLLIFGGGRVLLVAIFNPSD